MTATPRKRPLVEVATDLQAALDTHAAAFAAADTYAKGGRELYQAERAAAARVRELQREMTSSSLMEDPR